MAKIRIGGSAVPLPNFQGIITNTTGSNAGTTQGYTNAITLAAGQVWMIPSGTWLIRPGNFTYLQWLDPVTNIWKNQNTTTSHTVPIDSDGTNYRLSNLTGCAVGACITAIGTAGVASNGIGQTATGLTVTASSGSSVWVPIVGGAISATIATSTANASTAGAGYNYIPQVVIDAPPQGGLQATAIVTALASGTVAAAAIQVINQGAGYSSAPKMAIVPDPRESTATTPGPTVNAYYITTLTATGTLTGLYPSYNGTPLTGVPALTFGTGTAAATVLMNFVVTSYTTGTGGSGYPSNVLAMSINNKVTAQTTPAPVNPLHAAGHIMPRPARITAAVSGTAIIPTGAVVEDYGLGIQQVPTLIFVPAATTTQALITATVGGVSDTSYVQPV